MESFGSETTVVKKTVKKSVKSSKTTSTKKKTVSSTTTESSSISSSSKAESFENSFSNGSLETVERQESLSSNKSIDNSTASLNGAVVKEQQHAVMEAVQETCENHETQQVVNATNVNGETKKKTTNGKRKSKKKKSDEKENFSVVSHEMFQVLKKQIYTNIKI